MKRVSTQAALLATLADHARTHKTVTVNDLAATVGVSVRACERALGKLEDAKQIAVLDDVDAISMRVRPIIVTETYA